MRSMTGYGRGAVTTADGWEVSIELSAVNRKQVDIAVNLPNRFAALEADVRKQLGAAISRGRINARITVAGVGESSSKLVVDQELAAEYVKALKNLGTTLLGKDDLSTADLARLPGVFSLEDSSVEPENMAAPLKEAIATSLEALIAMQEVEGAHLKADLENRINSIAQETKVIAEVAPSVKENYRQNLHQRLKDSGLDTLDLNDERVMREIGLFAERCDISEELTRIDSHLGQFRSYFGAAAAESVGRPLDFLCQELNRELNTIGSKANDARIAQHIVNAKTELEKIREQVQNVQ